MKTIIEHSLPGSTRMEKIIKYADLPHPFTTIQHNRGTEDCLVCERTRYASLHDGKEPVIIDVSDYTEPVA